jgi:hypothetical protein
VIILFQAQELLAEVTFFEYLGWNVNQKDGDMDLYNNMAASMMRGSVITQEGGRVMDLDPAAKSVMATTLMMFGFMITALPVRFFKKILAE